MKTSRPLSIEDFLASIVPFLPLENIPNLYLNRYSQEALEKLRRSLRFLRSINIQSPSLQNEAKKILDDPMFVYDESNPELKSALVKILSGEIDIPTLFILQKQKLKYQAPNCDSELKVAGDFFRGAGELHEQTRVSLPFGAPQTNPADYLVLLFLALSLLSALYAGTKYIVESCMNRRQAINMQTKLQQRLIFFEAILPEEEKNRQENKCQQPTALALRKGSGNDSD